MASVINAQKYKPRWFDASLTSSSYNRKLPRIPPELLQPAASVLPIVYSKQKEIVSDSKDSEIPAIPLNPAIDVKNIPPLQQGDEMKPLLLDIGMNGLLYAYRKNYDPEVNPDPYKCKKTKHPGKVVIVGAGPAGLSAGYELKRAGHEVVILEMQHRVGGRVKTIGDSKFYKGLWGDAGAMRLPGQGDPEKQPSTEASHFMVDFYAGTKKFNIPKKPFVNTCENGYYKFYGKEQIRMAEWDKCATKYCNEYWPNWDKQIRANQHLKEDGDIIDGIGDYYDKSVQPVIHQLYKWIIEEDQQTAPDQKKEPAWTRWVKKWSRFSFKDFVTSTVPQIKSKIQQTLDGYDPSEEDDNDLKDLEDLLPWPIEAVVAYTTFSYTEDLDQSLVELLRDDIGQWWKMPMHTFTEGLEMLPWSFVKYDKNGGFEGDDMDLSKCIIFGARAHTIKYTAGTSIVTYRNMDVGDDKECVGDAVIVTLPVNIIRQLKFDPPLPPEHYVALENITYGPSTKILLQCRERFWEKQGIDGGFSKTDMPIGQLHYPSNPGFNIPNSERGILMCYTWKEEALLFGSQPPEDAIAEAVREIAEIHPKIEQHFEVGAVQPWYTDPSAQGAYGLLKPMQYLAVERLVNDPHESVYFAGEALSNTNGWIQGALESGLRAAFQFFERNELLFDDPSKIGLD